MTKLKIEPALTPEEWADLFANPDNWESYDHAAAAIALHGAPFGFTREDVEDELHAYADMLLRARDQGLIGMEKERDRLKKMAMRHLHRASRIAALLPPE